MSPEDLAKYAGLILTGGVATALIGWARGRKLDSANEIRAIAEAAKATAEAAQLQLSAMHNALVEERSISAQQAGQIAELNRHFAEQAAELRAVRAENADLRGQIDRLSGLVQHLENDKSELQRRLEEQEDATKYGS